MNKPNAPLYRKKSGSSDDNMVPLINIVFLLLIFFMVAGKIKVDNAKNIELPLAAQQENAVVHDVNISIDATGKIALDGLVLDSSALDTEIKRQLLVNQHIAVALQADSHLKAQQLTPVLSLLRKNGVEKIRLFTRVVSPS